MAACLWAHSLQKNSVGTESRSYLIFASFWEENRIHTFTGTFLQNFVVRCNSYTTNKIFLNVFDARSKIFSLNSAFQKLLPNSAY